MTIKLILLVVTLCFSTELISQIKLERPSGAVGIKIVDSVVARSFNLYDRLFDYHIRSNAGDILDEGDICDLEEIFSHSEVIILDARAAKNAIKNEKLLKKTKATIQLERAKRAIYYCHKTSKKLLLAQNTNIQN